MFYCEQGAKGVKRLSDRSLTCVGIVVSLRMMVAVEGTVVCNGERINVFFGGIKKGVASAVYRSCSNFVVSYQVLVSIVMLTVDNVLEQQKIRSNLST